MCLFCYVLICSLDLIAEDLFPKFVMPLIFILLYDELNFAKNPFFLRVSFKDMARPNV